MRNVLGNMASRVANRAAAASKWAPVPTPVGSASGPVPAGPAPSAPPPTPPTPQTVHTDGALTLDMAHAYRAGQQAGASASAPNSLLLPPIKAPQGFIEIFQLVMMLKQQGKLPQPPQPGRPITHAFIAAGLMDHQGNATPHLQSKLANPNLNLEFILQVAPGHYAAIVMNQSGMAFIDSTGAACPNVQIQIPAQPGHAPQQEPLQQVLMKTWVSFAGITDQTQAQQRAQRDCHFHNGVKLSGGSTEMSLDGVLTSFDVLAKGVASTPPAFQQAPAFDRAKLVAAIDGKPVPSTPGQDFQLTYVNASKDAARRQAWQQRVKRVKRNHKNATQQAKAADAQREADIAANPSATHAPLSSWVKVTLDRNTDGGSLKDGGTLEIHRDDDATDTYTTEDNDGVSNEIKETDTSIEATSSGGKAIPFYERFLKLAQDLGYALQDNQGRIKFPISINSIEPPAQQQACIKAFEAYFGQGNVKLSNAPASSSSATSTPPIAPSAVVAAPG